MWRSTADMVTCGLQLRGRSDVPHNPRGAPETDCGHEKNIQTLKGSTLPAVIMQAPKGGQVTGQKASFNQVMCRPKSPKFKTQKGRRQIQEIKK